MREKLNDNPVMQMAVIGLLVIVVGFLFVTRMRSASDSGGGTPPPTTTPAATPPTDPAAASAAPATAPTDPAAASDPAAAADPTAAATGIPSAAPAVGSGTVNDFKPGPGLPKSVVKAYDSGNAVALLITKQRGFDDKAMRRSVRSIKGKKDVTLLSTRVHDVADYSQVTQGVDLNRVPALVVIEPKKLAGKQQPPTASVSYGFRDERSVVQAVEDQLYKGKTLGYSPK